MALDVGMQRGHGVVIDAGFLQDRRVRQQQTEVHDVSPSVWLNAVRGKPADLELDRVIRAAENIYLLALGISKVQRCMGQLSGSGMDAPCWR
ncbi:MAG: hypothetical protein CBCREVIR_2069 [Candidatus Burkholderia crenata]|nr:MAG: hypothetical protein CBCREVIR_2069 [Candidatus Burkholderia crenata]